ncbi:MAG: 4Fe-4S dicluster domain-containing protein [Deltaproteobacteria bacterium]|nr:4Fe-4S dicluster domain-containing protein [Deltaproteobacteria bacterium]MBW2419369.1 4Fe-4S dicluster domain-containing protein [Deltaproteobacteria bacterium]
MPELDRRDFLKLVGVGAGAAAAAGCSDPIEKLVPYVVQPEEITPGIANWYASTCQECPVGCGVHVKTREGRPIKLEGAPDHPINRGTLCAAGQSSIGRTYHPDRYASPMVKGGDGLKPISWQDGEAKLVAKLKGSASKTWVLGSPVGPTLSGLIDGWVGAVGAAGRVVYEPFDFGNVRAAMQAVFERDDLPVFDLSRADFIVDFGSDFLDQGLSPVEQARGFADARDPLDHEHGGARFVSIGPRMSMSGSNADQWIAAAPGSEGPLALALAKAVFEHIQQTGGAIPGDAGAVEKVLGGVDRGKAAQKAGIERKTFDELVDALLHAKSPVALPPGVSATTTAGSSAAAAVLLLNALLGAAGKTMLIPPPGGEGSGSGYPALVRLVEAMKAGQVDVLLVYGSNPVYSLPAALGFVEALAKVGTVVSFASLADESSEAADLVLPDHSALESWGDAAPRAGVRSLVQPTVRPLHDTQALGDTFLSLGRALGASLPEGSFHEQLQAAWSDTNWREALAKGGVFGPAYSLTAEISSQVASLSYAAPKLEGQGEFTLIAYPHSLIGDGRGAALPWLQEVPDPVSRATWISWLELSPATAEKLGVTFGDVVEVSTGIGAGSVKLPAYPRGGIRDDCIGIAIGQGHTVGHYASLAGDGRPGEARGVSVISLLPAARDERGERAWLTAKAQVTPTGGFHRIPIVQWTDNQRGRNLAPTVSLADLASKGLEGAEAAGGDHGDGHGAADGAEHHAPLGGYHSEGHGLVIPFDAAFDAHPESEYRWGMNIDNDRCIGCSACVAACHIENNIPLVGEEGVAWHREMSWLRIERYVDEGDRSDGMERRPFPNREKLGETDVRYAPMLCQQCGSAPCESVCPVIATYHNEEGLNGMIYNRCVGTRYCANNCVYKVRRFNYFDYSQHNWPGLFDLMLNPDVTVRQQGVMEKCTFCVQRIQEARQTAKDEGRPIADGEVVTACQQSCPTQAISFGNLRDEKSQVQKDADEPNRSYHSLQVLNTRPAITYLSQVDRVKRDDDERSHG